MNYFEKMANACMDELQKIASKRKIAISATGIKALALLGAGAGGYHLLRKAKQDYQTGRQMRMQQGY